MSGACHPGRVPILQRRRKHTQMEKAGVKPGLLYSWLPRGGLWKAARKLALFFLFRHNQTRPSPYFFFIRLVLLLLFPKDYCPALYSFLLLEIATCRYHQTLCL
ncbi:hypothetical protein VPH35_089689 [Triticum aestivum]